MYLFMLFSLCLGYVKARSCVSILFQHNSVFQQNDDKKAAVLTPFFCYVSWLEFLKYRHWHCYTVRCGCSHQLVCYTSGVTLNFAVMTNRVHSNFILIYKLTFQILTKLCFLYTVLLLHVFTSFFLSYSLSHHL